MIANSAAYVVTIPTSSKKPKISLTYNPSNLLSYFTINLCSSFAKQSRRKNPKRKTDNLDDLKQELDIDFHKITPEELYQRFQTHPENVSISLSSNS